MKNISWVIIACLSLSIMFGCGGNAATGSISGDKSSVEANNTLPTEIADRLADYEMSKKELIVLKQDRDMLYNLYLTKGSDTSSGSASADLEKISELEDKLDAKKDELSSMQDDLILNKNDVKDLREKLTEANIELDSLKTELEEAKKTQPVVPTDKVNKVGIEGGILMKAAIASKSNARGLEIITKINDFVGKNPSEKDKFAEILATLSELPNVSASYNTDATLNFTDIAAITGNTMMKCPGADDLPGIVHEIIATEVKFAKSADITLLIDTTSTMKDEIDKLKRNISMMYPEITKLCKDVRISFVTYRDIDTNFGKVGYVTKIEGEFTRTLREIVQAVRKISVNTKGGNYDVPEAVYEGLMTTLTDLAWSDRAEKRIVLLIGDAPAGSGMKFLIHPKRGKRELGTEHKVSIDDVKKQLEAMKAAMMTEDLPISIIPIVCSEK
ncbi:MAG: hypothetical protein K8S87_08230 [Planctomycetes bacterium]|nr:hypothetical protein [Planctomycetota bacterium]